MVTHGQSALKEVGISHGWPLTSATKSCLNMVKRSHKLEAGMENKNKN